MSDISRHIITDTSFLVPLSPLVRGSYEFDQGSKQGLLHLPKGVPYPSEPVNSRVDRLILSHQNANTLILPDNFITLGQLLNDACGSGDHENGEEVGNHALQEVAKSLARAAFTGYVPKALSYENIVFGRDDMDVKLLPPIEFQEFDPIRFKSSAKNHMRKSLWESLINGAETDRQRRFIAGSFAGFINKFDW